MTRNKPITFLASAAALAATIIVVAACGSGGKTNSTPVATTNPAHSTAALTTWTLPGADAQNTRNVGGPINASNVSTLGVAWTLPITAHGAFGAYATTPVVANGVLYTQDLDSNVQAINFASGKVIWTHKYNSPNEGPNGLTFASGNLYGATDRAAFALDAATGKQLWTKTLVRNASEGIDMAPGYNDGTVYVSTVPGNTNTFYAGNGQAVLWAMDASTGSDQVEVRRGAREPLVLSAHEHQLGRWHVESADVRYAGEPVHRRVEPSAVHGLGEVSVGFEPSRAGSVHRLDCQAQRQDGQADLALPADAARYL